MNITINNKQYKVKEAKTEEELKQGLKGVKELPKDEGMLFYFDPPREVSMTMEDTLIPLDLIFIDEDLEVVSVITRKPKDKSLVSMPDIAYVLELNANSGVEIGDTLEFDEEDEGPVMKVLAPDGSTLYELWGGERIVSRRETKILIKKAKKAEESLEDKDYKALGRYIFKVFKGLDTRDPEYVELKN